MKVNLVTLLAVACATVVQGHAAGKEKGPVPPPNIPAEKLKVWMEVQNALGAGSANWSMEGLELSVQPSSSNAKGHWDKRAAFTVDEVNAYEPEKPKTLPKSGFAGFKLRESWSDVLASEDPTAPEPGSTYKDLKGAKLAYTRNGKKHTDAWTAQAALIAPFVWYNE